MSRPTPNSAVSRRVALLVPAALALAAGTGGIMLWNRSATPPVPTSTPIQGTDHMEHICAAQYPDLAGQPGPDWDRAEVERIWAEPIPGDLLLMGGPDQHGWARICRDPSDPPGILRGEYRDRAVLYRGRWQLVRAEGQSAPDWQAVLPAHYLSHYTEADGLVLYPLAPPAPPVPYLRLMPIDPDGFAPRKAD